MANLITVGRVLALFAVIYVMYVGSTGAIGVCALLLAVIIALDAVDGWVARKRNETSQFGAIFDIVGDRIVENALWIVFADMRLIPVWVPLLAISRGFLVDGLRSSSYSEGLTPFGEKNMMRSAFTRFLTAGRFMRALYGYAKAAGFVFLGGLWGWVSTDAAGTLLGALYDVQAFRWLGWGLVWTAVVLMVVRAIPVVVDSVAYIREKDARERLAVKS